MNPYRCNDWALEKRERKRKKQEKDLGEREKVCSHLTTDTEAQWAQTLVAGLRTLCLPLEASLPLPRWHLPHHIQQSVHYSLLLLFNPADPLLISLSQSALDVPSWLNEEAAAKCESRATRAKQEGGEKRKTSNLPSTLPSCCKAVSHCFSSTTTSLLLIFLNLPPLSLILCVAIYRFNPVHERPPQLTTLIAISLVLGEKGEAAVIWLINRWTTLK